jgi:transcriptional regulator with XRE-family HTH domain
MRAIRKHLGTRLKQLREEQSLRVHDVCAMLAIGAPHLYNVERGIANPSLELLISLATIYRVDVTDLFVFPEVHRRHAIREQIRHTPNAKLEEVEEAIAKVTRGSRSKRSAG